MGRPHHITNVDGLRPPYLHLPSGERSALARALCAQRCAMNPQIRQAVPEDAEQLSKIAEETFRATFSAENSVEDMELHCKKSFGVGVQRSEILDPKKACLLCECNGSLVGFAQLTWQPPPSCVTTAKRPGEIHRLYVTSKFHGQGVAQLLMTAALEEMARHETDIVWLGVWENNPRAISFYNKFDFIEVGDHRFRLGNDLQRDIIMSRTIEPGT